MGIPSRGNHRQTPGFCRVRSPTSRVPSSRMDLYTVRDERVPAAPLNWQTVADSRRGRMLWQSCSGVLQESAGVCYRPNSRKLWQQFGCESPEAPPLRQEEPLSVGRHSKGTVRVGGLLPEEPPESL